MQVTQVALLLLPLGFAVPIQVAHPLGCANPIQVAHPLPVDVPLHVVLPQRIVLLGCVQTYYLLIITFNIIVY